jgi:integral membrane protein
MFEASTLAILVFIAVPAKLLFKYPALVHVLGPIHGLVFVAYVWTLLNLSTGGELSGRHAKKLALLACIPLGGFVSVRWLSQRTRLKN